MKKIEVNRLIYKLRSHKEFRTDFIYTDMSGYILTIDYNSCIFCYYDNRTLCVSTSDLNENYGLTMKYVNYVDKCINSVIKSYNILGW